MNCSLGYTMYLKIKKLANSNAYIFIVDLVFVSHLIIAYLFRRASPNSTPKKSTKRFRMEENIHKRGRPKSGLREVFS